MSVYRHIYTCVVMYIQAYVHVHIRLCMYIRVCMMRTRVYICIRLHITRSICTLIRLNLFPFANLFVGFRSKLFGRQSLTYFPPRLIHKALLASGHLGFTYCSADFNHKLGACCWPPEAYTLFVSYIAACFWPPQVDVPHPRFQSSSPD